MGAEHHLAVQHHWSPPVGTGKHSSIVNCKHMQAVMGVSSNNTLWKAGDAGWKVQDFLSVSASSVYHAVCSPCHSMFSNLSCMLQHVSLQKCCLAPCMYALTVLPCTRTSISPCSRATLSAMRRLAHQCTSPPNFAAPPRNHPATGRSPACCSLGL